MVITNDNVVNSVKQGWNNLKQGTIDAFNSAIQAGKNAWQSFKEWMKNTVNNIVQSTVNGWNNLKQWTINTFNNIVDGAKQAWENLKTSVSDTIKKVKETFDQIKEIDLFAIGKNIIDGLINGIKSKAADVKNTVKDIASSIGDKIRGILDIHSPSRVMAKIGMYTSQGLAEGILNGASYVDKATTTLTKQLAAPFNDTYDLGISSSVSKINKSVSGEVTHQVNMSNTKQPATFNIRLDNQQFKAFVDDISQAQGSKAEINLLF